MNKIFKKVLAGITSAALVATLLVGLNVATTVKADDTAVSLKNWKFSRGGVDYNSEYLNGNEGRIGSVTMNGTNEVITGWKTNDPAEQVQYATQVSDGFKMDINNTGWDKDWDNDRFNPWQIQASMTDVDIIPGHIYTVSFKAYATKTKYCYVTFGCDVEGTGPYGEDILREGSNDPVIAFTTTEQTFTYSFTNWVEAKKLTVGLMLGNFSSVYDYAGNDWSSVITASIDAGYDGDVYISDFTIMDNGVNPTYVTPEKPAVTTPAPTTPDATTKAPTVENPTTQAPTTVAPVATKLAKVKKVKAKNTAAGKVKVTWKKVTNAVQYKVKVGKKTYKSKKTKLVVKKLSIGTYKVKVRALKANGYKAGAWSKTVKVKVTK